MILLDSDVVIDLLRNRPLAVNWFDRLRSQQNTSFALPGFALPELMDGTEDSIDLRQLQKIMKFFATLWLSQEGCQQALNLFANIHLRNAIGIVDVLIAHVALEQSIPLHTFNTKPYAAIPGLQTIQPYTR